MKFSVWAPRARNKVELVCAEQRFSLAPARDGYWQIDCAPAGLAKGYRYSIDGGPAVPDPRSRWQPEGVHGPSFVVDEAALRAAGSRGFRQQPLTQAVIYELHIGTFSPEGTYTGATHKLPHLAALGITHVEVMPLATFPGQHGWGYDGVFLFAPHPSYGTPLELARFIAACHRCGLAVLLDAVYNHLGPDGNYLSHYAPYFTDRVRTAWGDAVNYDGANSDGVRDFVLDNARMWLDDYGFDGLRLDAVGAIYSFEAVHLLEELARAVQQLAAARGRTLVLIAESDLNDPRLIRPPERGGFGLTAHWMDDFHHSLHRAMTGESVGYYMDFNGIEDLAKALREGYVYQGQHSPHRQRRHGREPGDVRPEQLVVNAQNHDQIGNRAKGERLSMLLNPIQLKAVAALTILSPFVPLLFQGEEWGATTPFLYFTDHQDPELARMVEQGRRKEFETFGWADEVPNPQSPQTFADSRLNWDELTLPVHQDLLGWYRNMIGLRSSLEPQPCLSLQVSCNAAALWLWFIRGEHCVAVNFSAGPNAIVLPEGAWQLLLSSVSATSAAPQWAAYETRIYARQR
ncbi:MAG TPA: malto-oligosyltrehalose trehalohydrolase [Steroidobacteraceae bacterium]|jgi:maltooligosyltrehalose trehalohydrolase|nr:malto-oligosyltrehalose trehalohydrolase [Steroidobacteraceae bacterium]